MHISIGCYTFSFNKPEQSRSIIIRWTSAKASSHTVVCSPLEGRTGRRSLWKTDWGVHRVSTSLNMFSVWGDKIKTTRFLSCVASRTLQHAAWWHTCDWFETATSFVVHTCMMYRIWTRERTRTQEAIWRTRETGDVKWQAWPLSSQPSLVCVRDESADAWMGDRQTRQ